MTTTDQPGILAVMADFMATIPHPVKRELHVAKPVWSFLRDTYAKVIRPETVSAMMDLPIIVDDTLAGGQWQIHEDGQVTTSGDMAPAPEGMTVFYSPEMGWWAFNTDLIEPSKHALACGNASTEAVE